MRSHDPIAPEGEGRVFHDGPRGGEGAADQRLVETPPVPGLVPQLPQMPEHDALGVDLLHGLRRVDPASGEEEPQVGTPPGRDELRLGAASAVARVVEQPVPDPDLNVLCSTESRNSS